MPDNKLELIVEVDVDRANASIESVNKGLSSFEQAAKTAARGASQGIDATRSNAGRREMAGLQLSPGLLRT